MNDPTTMEPNNWDDMFVDSTSDNRIEECWCPYDDIYVDDNGTQYKVSKAGFLGLPTQLTQVWS